MNKIKILSESVYSKIAAGEVVERPASIVRELLDNSIDAGSTEISINIEDGGLQKITVTDNGHGISKEDLPLALSMHATSKIEEVNDLLNLYTMGFRGEALHSIKTVSKLQVTTNTDETGKNPGYKLSNYGDNKDQIINTACKKGTKIEVSEIFYNIPARKKFLKSSRTEWTNIKKVVINKVFSKLNTSFKLVHNNENIFTTKGNRDFKQAFFSIFKNENSFNINSHEKKINSDIKLKIFHSSSDIYFSTRKYQQLFVNNRPINTNFFYPAIDLGIRNFISPGRHPLIFFYLDINPSLIDVNIHPAKKEIKFDNQNEIFNIIRFSIGEALSSIVREEIINIKSDNFITTEKQNTLDFSEINEENQNHKTHTSFVNYEVKNYYDDVIKKEENYNDNISEEIFKTNKNYNILGVSFDTYIIVEKDEKILFIDQHAAAETIIYNRKLKKYEQTKNIEKLMIPIIFDLDTWNDDVNKKIGLLNSNGFLIEKQEGTTLNLRELPEILLVKKNYDKVISLIKNYLTNQGSYDKNNIINSLLIEASCKEAIKKGDKLTILEMAEIVDEYFKLDIHNCPHGRPIYFELSKDKLEKVFQRKK